MSILHSPTSLLYGTYGLWNLVTFSPLLLGEKRLPTGFALTYPPFAAGTSWTLAVAPSSIRIVHSIATAVLCLPHVFGHADDTGGAKYHFGVCVTYLASQILLWARSKQADLNNKRQDSSVTDEKNPDSTTIPVGARILSGLLGVSQIGVSLLFTANYLKGDPKTYEPFLVETLSTTDEVPLSVLTSEFLRSVYLAGTYSVLGIGWGIATGLTRAVVTNSRQDCFEALSCMSVNLSTQVLLHSICYVTGGGGPDLHRYMFVHGPISAPVLIMVLGATYLCRPRSVGSSDTTKAQTKKSK